MYLNGTATFCEPCMYKAPISRALMTGGTRVILSVISYISSTNINVKKCIQFMMILKNLIFITIRAEPL